MLDGVAVERIGELVGPCRSPERRPGGKLEQEPLPAAMSAVALDGLVELSCHGQLDGTAMTTSGLSGFSLGSQSRGCCAGRRELRRDREWA